MRGRPERHRSRLGLLLAPDGQCVRDGSLEFLDLLGDHDPDYDGTLFAILNLGFVYSRRDGQSLEILVHPRNAGQAAVDAAIGLIGASGAERFTITYLGRLEWQRETSNSARHTCVRLLELCQAENGPTSLRAFGNDDRDSRGQKPQGPSA